MRYAAASKIPSCYLQNHTPQMRFHEICRVGWLLVGPRRLDGHCCCSPLKCRGSAKIDLIVFYTSSHQSSSSAATQVAAFNLTDLKLHLQSKFIFLLRDSSGRGEPWSERNFLKRPLTTWDLSY